MLGLALILSLDGLSILRRVSACLFPLVLWLKVTNNHNSCPGAEELSLVRWLSVGARHAELLSAPQ